MFWFLLILSLFLPFTIFNWSQSSPTNVDVYRQKGIRKRVCCALVLCVHLPLGKCSPLFMGIFFCVFVTTKHKPFLQTNGSYVWRGVGPGPNRRDGFSLTAAFISLLFLLHTQGFLGFPKYFFCRLLPLSPSVLPLALSCDWLLWQTCRLAVSFLWSWL